MENKLKVLVVDDTLFMRRAVSGILELDPDIEVVGTAKNGLESLKMIQDLKPDVITMDIDMPVMDGLTAIRHIMIETPVPIVALSSLVTDGAVTFEALRLGVVDFVPKPSGAVSRDIDKSRQIIINRVKIAQSVNMDNVRRVRLLKNWNIEKRVETLYKYRPLDYGVIIGTTLSGPNTIIRLLSNLAPTIPASVIVVQEVSSKIIDSFVRQFNEHVPWRIEVGHADQELEQGVCYMGSTEAPLSLAMNTKGRPCLKETGDITNPLDTIFSSAADVFRQNTIGVLLTGLGNDGATGFADIKRESGVTMAQESECCVYPNLVHNAVNEGVVNMVIDENKLAGAIESAAR